MLGHVLTCRTCMKGISQSNHILTYAQGFKKTKTLQTNGTIERTCSHTVKNDGVRTKCHTDKMPHGQNATRTKCHTDKMSHGQNVTKTKLCVLKGEEFLTSNYAVNYHIVGNTN